MESRPRIWTSGETPPDQRGNPATDRLTFVQPTHHSEFKVFAVVTRGVEAEDGGRAFTLQFEGRDDVELLQGGICQDWLQGTGVQPLAGGWQKIKD